MGGSVGRLGIVNMIDHSDETSDLCTRVTLRAYTPEVSVYTASSSLQRIPTTPMIFETLCFEMGNR